MSEEKECPACREQAEARRSIFVKVCQEAKEHADKEKIKTRVYRTPEGFSFCAYSEWKEYKIRSFLAVYVP